MGTVKKMGTPLPGIHDASSSCPQGLCHQFSHRKGEYTQNLQAILTNAFGNFIKFCFLEILKRLHLAGNLFHASPNLRPKAIPQTVGLASLIGRLAFQYLSPQFIFCYNFRVCIFAEQSKTIVGFLEEPQLKDSILEPANLIFLDTGHKIFPIRQIA